MRAFLTFAGNANKQYEHFGSSWGDMAVREARAILEDAEPGMLKLCGTPYEQSTPLWARPLKGDRDVPFHKAMKAALQAFVKD